MMIISITYSDNGIYLDEAKSLNVLNLQLVKSNEILASQG